MGVINKINADGKTDSNSDSESASVMPEKPASIWEEMLKDTPQPTVKPEPKPEVIQRRLPKEQLELLKKSLQELPARQYGDALDSIANDANKLPPEDIYEILKAAVAERDVGPIQKEFLEKLPLEYTPALARLLLYCNNYRCGEINDICIETLDKLDANFSKFETRDIMETIAAASRFPPVPNADGRIKEKIACLRDKLPKGERANLIKAFLDENNSDRTKLEGIEMLKSIAPEGANETVSEPIWERAAGYYLKRLSSKYCTPDEFAQISFIPEKWRSDIYEYELTRKNWQFCFAAVDGVVGLKNPVIKEKLAGIAKIELEKAMQSNKQLIKGMALEALNKLEQA
jgi:hypothetical protein